jgi:hypothetical protein
MFNCKPTHILVTHIVSVLSYKLYGIFSPLLYDRCMYLVGVETT